MPRLNSLAWPTGRKLETIQFQSITKHPQSINSAFSKFNEDPEDVDRCKTNSFAGFTSDNRYSWLAKKSMISITKANNKNCPITYDFAGKYDQDCYLTCCAGFGDLLLIGAKNEDGKGFVHLFNPNVSRLLKTIEIPYAVTSIDIVSIIGGADKALHIFFKNLRWLFGIAAVGTEEGHVFLVDLRLDDDQSFMEDEDIRQIEIIPPHAKNVTMLREASFDQNTHLAFELNRPCHEEGLFHFINQENEIIESYYPTDISVTSICFEPRCSMIFIGYSFGQFQMFALNKMELIFGSDMETNELPISKFSFQEPENDPKNFCYLWVINGQREDSVAVKVNMFQLMFAEKQINVNASTDSNELLSKKVFYYDLQICGLRFEQILCENLGRNCRCDFVQCQTVENYHKGNDLNVSIDEEMGMSPESSVCVIAWESNDVSRHAKHSSLNIFLFDINRWYLAQMPGGLRNKLTDRIYCSFWSNDTSKFDKVLAVNVDGMMKRYFFNFRPPPDEFLRPSALSFKCNALTESAHIACNCCGVQAKAIESLRSNKEQCLLDPEIIFNELHSAGLIVLLKVKGPMSVKVKRESIFTACLQHSLVTFLMSLMQNTATGKYAAAGCTLRMFHDWMWNTVQSVKEDINALCYPIFDCTSAILDTNVVIQFNSYITQILHLRTLFELLYQLSTDLTEGNMEDLKTKVVVVKLIHDYISAVKWFINNNLLPEQLPYEDEANIFLRDGILIYIYSDLKSLYSEQRKTLKECGDGNLLMIDGMIDSIGTELTTNWQQAGGESCYPPPSLMDLLNIYYIDAADILSKNCVVIYFLLDLLDMFESKREMMDEDDVIDYDVLTRIGHFPQHFGVPLSVVKLIQGFWHLDHKGFDEALDKFLSCDTAAPYLEWQDKNILQAFLSQNCNSHALKYMLHRLGENSLLSDINLQLNIYVRNYHLQAAWKLVQQSKQEDVFEYFMHLCEENKLLSTLLAQPLTKKEEDAILTYLSKSNELSSHHQMVLYYFKRGRYVEGIQAYNHTGMSHTISSNLNQNRKHQVNLQKIVRAYSHVLPKVERDRAYSKRVLKTLAGKKEMYKVKPTKSNLLSMSMESPMTQATSLSRKQETKMNDMKNQMLFTPFRKKPVPKILEKIVEKPTRRESVTSMLLQTPPIQRSRRQFSVKDFPDIAISTPQSILKKKNFNKLVRNIPEKETLPGSSNGVYLIEDSGIENKDLSPDISLSQKRLSDWVESTTKNLNNKELVEDSSPELPTEKCEKQSLLRDRFNDSIRIATPQTPKVLRFNLASLQSEPEVTPQKVMPEDNALLETIEVDVTGISSTEEEEEEHEEVIESQKDDEVVLVVSSDEEVSSMDEDEEQDNMKLEEEVPEVIDHGDEIQEISSDDEIILNYQVSDSKDEEDKSDAEEVAIHDLPETREVVSRDLAETREVETEDFVEQKEEICTEEEMENEDASENENKDNSDIYINADESIVSEAPPFKENVAEEQEEPIQETSADDEGVLYVSCTSSSSAVSDKLDWVKTADDIGIVPQTSASEPEDMLIQSVQNEDDNLQKSADISHTQIADPQESVIFSPIKESSPIKITQEHKTVSPEKEVCSESSDKEIHEEVEEIIEMVPEQEEDVSIDQKEVSIEEYISIEEEVTIKEIIVSEEQNEGIEENFPKDEKVTTEEEKNTLNEESVVPNEENSSNEENITDVLVSKEVKQESESHESLKSANTDSELDAKVEIVKDEVEMDVKKDTKSEDNVSPEALIVNKAESQILDKLKSDPLFVLSPPKSKPLKKTRSSSRVVEKSRQIQNAEAVEPSFVFTPPTTRKRSMRKADDTDLSTAALDTSVSSVLSVTLCSKRTTPSRKGKVSNPETPTRSSSRLRKKSQLKEATPSRSTRRKTTEKKLTVTKTPNSRSTEKQSIHKKSGDSSDSEVDHHDTQMLSIPKVTVSSEQTSCLEINDDNLLSTMEEQEVLPVTPLQKKEEVVAPLRRTPSRKAKLKSGYNSSVTTDTDATAGITSESEEKPKRSRKTSATQTKTPTRSTRSKKGFSKKKSWSPGKEGINLLPAISESEDVSVGSPEKNVAKKKSSKNPAPPKIYPRRTRSQRKSYAIK